MISSRSNAALPTAADQTMDEDPALFEELKAIAGGVEYIGSLTTVEIAFTRIQKVARLSLCHSLIELNRRFPLPDTHLSDRNSDGLFAGAGDLWRDSGAIDRGQLQPGGSGGLLLEVGKLAHPEFGRELDRPHSEPAQVPAAGHAHPLLQPRRPHRRPRPVAGPQRAPPPEQPNPQNRINKQTRQPAGAPALREPHRLTGLTK